MSKRGSLSLSVNAIVILVLAITMLGLGISFVRGVFEKFDIKYDLPVANPTDSEPIVLPSGEYLTFSKNGETLVQMKFKNIGSVDATTKPLIGCDFDNTGDISWGDDREDLHTKVLKMLVRAGESAEFKITVAPRDSSAGQLIGEPNSFYVCVVRITEDGSPSGNLIAEKQFNVKIKS